MTLQERINKVLEKPTIKDVIIDDDMRELFNSRKWHVKESPGLAFYPITKINDKNIPLHHLILPKKEGFEIDHINRNGMDNRRANLRYATKEQNARNKRVRKDSPSGIKGVRTSKGLYYPNIFVNKKRQQLGTYHNPELAGKIYQIHAMLHYEEFAYKSFDLTPEELSELWEYYYYARVANRYKRRKQILTLPENNHG